MRKHELRFPEVKWFPCLRDLLWRQRNSLVQKLLIQSTCIVSGNTTPFSTEKSEKYIYGPLYSCSLKFYSVPQINWLCRWKRRTLLSAKCWIERLSEAASHQSSTNYAGYPRSIERSEACREGGWKAEWRILGSYQFKLWLKSVRTPTGFMSHLHPRWQFRLKCRTIFRLFRLFFHFTHWGLFLPPDQFYLWQYLFMDSGKLIIRQSVDIGSFCKTPECTATVWKYTCIYGNYGYP